MKIILTAAVANLGKIGDIVSVKNGYAKNFLIPNKKAICSTVNNSKIFESKRKDFEQANDAELATAKNVQEKISGKDVVIIENASDDGRLYGSVNSTLIASKINEVVKEKAASRVNVFLKKPIKDIGVYSVKLSLHSDVVIDVQLVVARSESEVSLLLKAKSKAEEEAKAEAKAEATKAKPEKKVEEVAKESSEDEKPEEKQAEAA